MAKPLLVANWKNYPASLEEAKDLLKAYVKKKPLYKKTRLFVAPPLPYFELVAERLHGWGDLAAQDLSLEKGTHTGEVGLEIVKSFGARLAILGHSERRALGEKTEEVAVKVAAALKAGIAPLICFGERERDAEGEHFHFLQEELKMLLSKVGKKDATSIMLAYEPIWAVGEKATGAMEPEELGQTVMFIKKVLTDLFNRDVAEKVPILYGGSVDAVNAGLLTRNSGVRGVLVGRASLKPQTFAEIAEAIT